MSLDGFARRLAARGPVLARWPAAEAAAATALLRASAEARRLLAEAAALDAALQATLPHPSAAAVARLQAGVARAIARQPLPVPPGPWHGLGHSLHPVGWGALVVLGAMALWLGLAPPGRGAEEPMPVLTTMLLPGDSL